MKNFLNSDSAFCVLHSPGHGAVRELSRPCNVVMIMVQTYARVAGVLLVLSIIGGGFGEAYVPARIIVAGDAAATVKNLHDLDFLFRLGFAGYLVEAVCDIALALLFYVLLRPVHAHLALLAAFFGILSTALFAVAELFFAAAPFLLRNAALLKSFSPDQVNALALLSVRFYGYGAAIFMVFYGVACILRGFLIVRSDYLPKFLGALLALAGAGFVAKNFALLLAPAYASDYLLLPMFLAVISLAVWFLVKGVDVAKWEASGATL